MNLQNKKELQQKPKKKLNRWQKILLWVLLVLIVGGIASFGYAVYKTNQSLSNITSGNSSLLQVAKTLLPGAPTTELKADADGRTNVLLLGMRGVNDPNGGLLSDSIIVVSIQQVTKQIAMVSIPRDLLVTVDGYGASKLNAVHALGYKESPEKGLLYSMDVVSEITGMPIHYGVSVDFTSFKGIIDALGGITVDAATDFYDPNYEGGIRVSQGLNDLNSDRALKYVWARLSTNDFDRSRRQREVLVAIKNKAEETGALTNPVFLFKTLDSLGSHVRTTATVEEMKVGLEKVQEYNLETIIQKGYDTSIDGPFTSETDPILGYIIIPRAGRKDFSDFQEDVQSIFMIEQSNITPVSQ